MPDDMPHNEHAHIHRDGDPLDYNEITDGIYVGTNQCCAAGLSEVLKKEEVSADISLEDVRIDQPFGVAMYVWLPTRDKTPPSHDQLSLGVGALEEMVRQKRKVYVHCKNGHGRAPTLVAAYVITHGKTPEEAVAFIKEKRPSIHLEKSQVEMLAVFHNSRAIL